MTVNKETLRATNSIGLILMHIGACYGLYSCKFSVSFILVFLVTYQIKIIGISIGYHRYFAHKSFKTKPIVEIILALFGTFAGQGPLERWVFNHWSHHQHSDKEKDPHSPYFNNFFYGHIGWLFRSSTYDNSKYSQLDLKLSKPVKFISNNFTVIYFLQIPFLYLIGGKDYVFSGFFISTVFSLQSMFLTGSVCHLFGTQEYQTNDNSRNNLFVSLLTNGEGWHNNHHYSPSSARHGHKKHELDISFYLIKLLEYFKLASKIKLPREQKEKT